MFGHSATTTTTMKPQQDSRPWVERYRPANLDQVAHQTEIVATLKDAVKSGRLPHLLLYGPPGSGKTSVALALCRQLWPPSEWKRRVLELNASDERGISVVRDKIKHFASLAVSSSTSNIIPMIAANQQSKNDDNNNIDNDHPKETYRYPNPPFKIIILDEADTVTTDAQAALRRIIEAFSRTTRFILICNYVTRIIEPVASRCAKFRFQALPPETMRARLMEICQMEGCDGGDRTIVVVEDVLKHSQGDMRKAVTTLQALLVAASVPNANVQEISGTIPQDVVDAVWSAMTTSKRFDVMAKQVEDLIVNAGFSAQTLLGCLLDKLLLEEDPHTNDTLDEVAKASIAIRLAEAEKNLIEGADEYLQLLTVGSMVFESVTLKAR